MHLHILTLIEIKKKDENKFVHLQLKFRERCINKAKTKYPHLTSHEANCTMHANKTMNHVNVAIYQRCYLNTSRYTVLS